MKIAIVSPLPPDHSGIADYTAHLAKILLTSSQIQSVDLYRATEFNTAKYELYDRVIYQVGNNAKFHWPMMDIMSECPGIVELHDLTLHNMFATVASEEADGEEIYVREFEYNFGPQGEAIARHHLHADSRPWETLPNHYPLLGRVLDGALAVVVHSHYAKLIVRKFDNITPCTVVPLLGFEEVDLPPRRIFDNHGPIRFASFGQVQPNKHISFIIKTLSRFNKRFEFEYWVIGPLGGWKPDLQAQIKSHQLDHKVFLTDRVEKNALTSLLQKVDIAINLREPTYGETSAALLTLLHHGIPTIVTNHGSYGEIPSSVVIRTSPSGKDLYDKILWLASQPKVREKFSTTAQQWVRYWHGAQNILGLYEKVLFSPYNLYKPALRRYARRVSNALSFPQHQYDKYFMNALFTHNPCAENEEVLTYMR